MTIAKTNPIVTNIPYQSMLKLPIVNATLDSPGIYGTDGSGATGLKILVRKEIMNTVIGDIDNEQDNYFVLDFNNYNKASILMWINKKPSIRTSRDKYDWKSVAKKYDCLYSTLLR